MFFLSAILGILVVAKPCTANGLAQLKPEDRHGDYMKQIELNVPAPNKNLNSAIFDKTISAEMTQKYSAFNAPYQARQAYQLNGTDDYMRYQKSSKDLAEWTIKKLLQYHFENTVRKNAEQAVEREAKESKSDSTKAAARAVQTIASVQRALQESTMNFGADTKTKFHYDFPSGKMQVGMTSPVVNTTVDYRVALGVAQVGTVNEGDDRVRVAMTRNISFLKASTSVRYGMLGQMNYGVNKQLAGPLSAGVDQSHNLRDNSKDETLVRLNFGTSF